MLLGTSQIHFKKYFIHNFKSDFQFLPTLVFTSTLASVIVGINFNIRYYLNKSEFP